MSGNACSSAVGPGSEPELEPGRVLHPGPHAGHFSVPEAALLAALMALLALATVLGNALVVVAFAVDRSLRSRGNFFFLNLAVADLLVGECRSRVGEPGSLGAGALRGAGSAGTLRQRDEIPAPLCARRRRLHPTVHPLCPDREVEVGEDAV